MLSSAVSTLQTSDATEILTAFLEEQLIFLRSGVHDMKSLDFQTWNKSSLSVYCLSMLCTRCVEVNTIFFFTSSTMIFTDSLHSADFGLMLHDGKICMKRAIIIYDWVSIHNKHAERMQGNKALAVS